MRIEAFPGTSIRIPLYKGADGGTPLPTDVVDAPDHDVLFRGILELGFEPVRIEI
jgi:hypothetical protein